MKRFNLFGKKLSVKSLLIGSVITIASLSLIGVGVYVLTDSGDNTSETEVVENYQQDTLVVVESEAEIETKLCQSEKLGIRMNILENWSCEVKDSDNTFQEIFIRSGTFDILVSNAPTGFCEEQTCVFKDEYDSDVITLQSIYYKDDDTYQYLGDIKNENHNTGVYLVVNPGNFTKLSDDEFNNLQLVLDSLEVIADDIYSDWIDHSEPEIGLSFKYESTFDVKRSIDKSDNITPISIHFVENDKRYIDWTILSQVDEKKNLSMDEYLRWLCNPGEHDEIIVGNMEYNNVVGYYCESPGGESEHSAANGSIEFNFVSATGEIVELIYTLDHYEISDNDRDYFERIANSIK